MKPTDHFAAFVSPVAGALVRRYGTDLHIGQVAGSDTEVDPRIVVPISHGEWAKYSNEYRRAISEGSLKKRDAAAWEAAEAVALKAATDADAKMKADAKAAAEAAKKAAEPTAPEAEPKKGSDR